MNKIKKPEWLLYAEQVRERVVHMRPMKSGEPESQATYSAWLKAKFKMDYKGSEYD